MNGCAGCTFAGRDTYYGGRFCIKGAGNIEKYYREEKVPEKCPELSPERKEKNDRKES